MTGPAIAAPKMTAPASDRVAAKWIMRIKISGSPTPSLPGGDVRRTLGEPICRRERCTRLCSNGYRPRFGRRGGERRAGGRAGAIEMRMRVGGGRARQDGEDHKSSNAGVDGHESGCQVLAKPV